MSVIHNLFPHRRRAASACALLAVLMALLAAPYLIPENPDSAVFRAGALGTLLLGACFVPVRQAFLRANCRTLASCLVWGFLFAVALSLGSELLIYGGLLSGMGSLLRRLAVPVLAAPLIGGLCARALTAERPFAQRRAWHVPGWVYALILLLGWLPVLLAYFPGMLNYDFAGEYMQHIEQSYSNIHPLLHSVLMNGIITIGEMLHSRTFGLFLMSLLQMLLFASSLAYVCAFVQRHGAPGWILALLTAFFALHPVFSVMSVSMTKDTLFCAAIVVLSLMTWTLIEKPDAFFSSRSRCAAYVLLSVCVALLRNNGLFALALLLPGILIAMRGFRRQSALLAASCAGAIALVTLALNLAFSPESLPSFQLYSLPAQQLVRAYNGGGMNEEDAKTLEGWYTDEAGLVLHPHLADSAKGYLDKERLEREGGDFLALWLRAGKTNPRAYLEAFLMLNIGSWYPDDLSHATIYPDVSYNDKGYLQTQEIDMSEYGLHTTSFLPGIRAFYERICRRNEYQKFPLAALLFCTATPFWLLLLACAALFARQNARFLPAALGVLGLWLSYLFGPCTLPRYILPLFCLAPALLTASLCTPSESQKEKHV